MDRISMFWKTGLAQKALQLSDAILSRPSPVQQAETAKREIGMKVLTVFRNLFEAFSQRPGRKNRSGRTTAGSYSTRP